MSESKLLQNVNTHTKKNTLIIMAWYAENQLLKQQLTAARSVHKLYWDESEVIDLNFTRKFVYKILFGPFENTF